MNTPGSDTVKTILAATALLWGTSCLAGEDDTLAQLQGAWARANYELEGDAQERAFEALVEQARTANETYPKSAELLVWSGIIQSSFAGNKGGLGALKLAKAARSDLEQALEIDPAALQGSAYTSLGALYYKVPGWPIGFGDEDKAEELLRMALDMNPDGIDPNYFYGDFLLDQKRYEEAEAALLRARAAAPRPERQLADNGRQREISADLDRVKEALGR